MVQFVRIYGSYSFCSGLSQSYTFTLLCSFFFLWIVNVLSRFSYRMLLLLFFFVVVCGGLFFCFCFAVSLFQYLGNERNGIQVQCLDAHNS